MEDFIRKLRVLKETLTQEEKTSKLYFYISKNLKEQFGEENESYEYFYINNEESHNKKDLIYEYPASDFIYKLLNLLDAYECA